MTDIDKFNTNQKPHTPITTSFFDHFYLGSTLLSLSSITATKVLSNVKTLPFFTAVFVIGTAGASWYWKRKDVEQINKLSEEVQKLTSEKSSTPTKIAVTSEPNPFQTENEQLKKLVAEQAKKIEELEKKLTQNSATPSNYKPFQPKLPNQS